MPSLPTRLVAGAVRCWCDAHYISHRGSLVPPPSSPLLPRQPHATSPHWGAADGSLSVATGDLDAAGEDDGRMFYRYRQVLLSEVPANGGTACCMGEKMDSREAVRLFSHRGQP